MAKFNITVEIDWIEQNYKTALKLTLLRAGPGESWVRFFKLEDVCQEKN